MEIIEFKAKIKNGVINVPEKYKQKIHNIVKVIIITEKNSKQIDIIDKLLENPVKLNDFKPFSRGKIYERL
jgi:hypothetical protein